MGKVLWNWIEIILQFIIYKILRLKISEDVWRIFLQFVKFGIVGFSNTVIGYVIYVVTLKMLRIFAIWSDIDIYIAQFVMFFLSVLWSFYWNNKTVFQLQEGEHRNVFAALVKTYISYAFTSLILAELLLHLWVNTLGISEYIAPVINLLITVPLNFMIQKLWAFKQESED